MADSDKILMAKTQKIYDELDKMCSNSTVDGRRWNELFDELNRMSTEWNQRWLEEAQATQRDIRLILEKLTIEEEERLAIERNQRLNEEERIRRANETTFFGIVKDLFFYEKKKVE